MSLNVLVIGSDERLRHALEFFVDEARVRLVDSPSETEGLDTDVVVIAGLQPMADLKEVRVHPMLHSTPVVLLAPGQRLDEQDWTATQVYPITESSVGLLDELTEQVQRLAARAHHPSSQRPLVASLRPAS